MRTRDRNIDEAKEVYSAFLKRRKMFFTKERSLLLESIFEREDHFSADELLFDLQKANKKISRATLYRSLSQMVESGILTESDFGHGHTHYEIALGDRPHVHLVGLESGDVREVYSEKLERLLEQLASQEGFHTHRYKIQLFGEFLDGAKGRSRAAATGRSK